MRVGFRFSPNRDELVAYFLLNRITGDSRVCDGLIGDSDLYGSEEPWQTWEKFGGDAQDLYFFTHLKKKTPKASRFDRTVGKGTWHGDGVTEFQASFGGVSIPGCRRRFNYRNKSSDQHGAWILHEFSSSSLSNTIVVCMLRKKETTASSSSSSNVDSRKRKAWETEPHHMEPKRSRFEEPERPLEMGLADHEAGTPTVTSEEVAHSDQQLQMFSDLTFSDSSFDDFGYGTLFINDEFQQLPTFSPTVMPYNEMVSYAGSFSAVVAQTEGHESTHSTWASPSFFTNFNDDDVTSAEFLY